MPRECSIPARQFVEATVTVQARSRTLEMQDVMELGQHVLETRSDTLRGHRDVPDIQNKTYTTGNATEYINTVEIPWKHPTYLEGQCGPADTSITPDLLARGVVSRMGEPEEIGDQTDASYLCAYHCKRVKKSCKHVRNSGLTCQRHKNTSRQYSEAGCRTDVSIVVNDSGIPEKGIRTCQNKRKTLYTPDKSTKTRTEKLQNLRNDSDTSGTRVRVGMKVGTQAK